MLDLTDAEHAFQETRSDPARSDTPICLRADAEAVTNDVACAVPTRGEFGVWFQKRERKREREGEREREKWCVREGGERTQPYTRRGRAHDSSARAAYEAVQRDYAPYVSVST